MRAIGGWSAWASPEAGLTITESPGLLEEVQTVPEAEEREAKPSGAQVPDCQLQDRFQQLHDSLNNAGRSLRLRPLVKQAR